MAFPSFSRSGSRDAGVVKLTADTGEFNAKVEAAERQWRESTALMSREALKLDLAQDRLKRSLAQYGAESSQAKRATIALKDAEDAATRSTQRLDQAHDRTRRGMVSLRSAAVAAAGAVGVYGLASAIRSAISAASEQELVLGQTRVALEAAGLSWDEYGDRVEEALSRQSKALAFDDEALARSFQTFVRQTKNVEEALKRNELAADLARGRYMSLEQATQLVTKAALGQAGALRRVGIDTAGAKTGVELLARLTEQYGQAAEKAATTSQAAQDRWNVSLENAKEALGSALLPTFTRYVGKLTEYVDKASESGELQERVNRILEDTEEIVSGVAKGMSTLRSALGPVVEGLGGMERAAQTLFTVFAVSKLLGIAGAIRGIGTAAAFSRTQIGLLNSTPVTVATTAAATTATGSTRQLPGTTGRGSGLVGYAAVIAATIGVGFLTQPPSLRQQQRAIADMSRVDKSRAAEMVRAFSAQFGTSIDDLTTNNPLLEKYGEPFTVKSGPGPGTAAERKGGRGGIPPGPADDPSTAPAPAPPAPPGPRTTLPRGLGDAINLAALSPGLRDDLTAAGNVRDFWRAQLARAKKGTKIYSAILSELVAANRAVESIEDTLAAEQQRHDDAIEAKRRKAAEARIAKAKAAAERRQRDAARVARVLDPGPYATTSKGFASGGLDPSKLKTQAAADGLTAADIARQIHDFLARFQEIQDRYAGTNVRPNVIVNQTFPAPTPDRHMEARFARFAMEAALSG